MKNKKNFNIYSVWIFCIIIGMGTLLSCSTPATDIASTYNQEVGQEEVNSLSKAKPARTKRSDTRVKRSDDFLKQAIDSTRLYMSNYYRIEASDYVVVRNSQQVRTRLNEVFEDVLESYRYFLKNISQESYNNAVHNLQRFHYVILDLDLGSRNSGMLVAPNPRVDLYAYLQSVDELMIDLSDDLNDILNIPYSYYMSHHFDVDNCNIPLESSMTGSQHSCPPPPPGAGASGHTSDLKKRDIFLNHPLTEAVTLAQDFYYQLDSVYGGIRHVYFEDGGQKLINQLHDTLTPYINRINDKFYSLLNQEEDKNDVLYNEVISSLTAFKQQVDNFNLQRHSQQLKAYYTSEFRPSNLYLLGDFYPRLLEVYNQLSNNLPLARQTKRSFPDNVQDLIDNENSIDN